MKLGHSLAVAAALWAVAAFAQAADQPPKGDFGGDFWSRVTLEVPVATRHMPHDSWFNDNNWGLLADVALNEDWSLVGGGYKNSFDRNTAIAGVSWEPLSVRVGKARLRGGGLAAIDLNGGYRGFNNVDPFLAALNVRLIAADQDAGGVLSRAGMLLTVIPAAEKDGSTAVNLALTYRLK
jgi:hypothetical protein